MEQDPDSPPTFWFQPPRATNRRRTPPIDPVVLIILIPILALIFLFFFLPPFLSHFSHILSHISKPASVKSTWDSLNIFLVLFAILCGVLARQNDDAPSSSTDVSNGFVTEGSSSSSGGGQSSGQWTGFSDRKGVPGGLRRNSSSYPNLRNESVWESENQNQNRFFDDFNLYSSPANRYYNNLSQRTGNLYGPVELSGDLHRRSRRSEADRVEFTDEKEIFVDTFEVRSNTPKFQRPPATPPPPPPLPPPPPRSAPAAISDRHSFRSVAKNVTVKVPPETESDVFDEMKVPPPPPPPPPPPSTEVKVHRSRNKHKKLERKVSDATKEIATAISSLYNQRKRKNKRKLRNDSGSSDTSPPSVHSVRAETEQISQQTPSPPLPPPPPPPPPPPSRFQNLFKKGGKHKRIHSVPVNVSRTVPPPPPPPPPPPSSIFNNILKSVSKSKRFHSHSHSTALPPPPSSNTNRVSKTESKSKRFNSIFSQPPAPPPLPPPMTPPRYTVKSKQISSNRRNESKPPLPTKTSSYYDREEFLPSGSQSPLIPMPPPPPPPFKMKAMKFELRGDFVRIQSTHSSVCSSPERDVDISSLGMDGGDSIGPGSGLGLGSGPRFHPSPDVNAKAERFISRLKDEWRMEKKNYGKEKMG